MGEDLLQALTILTASCWRRGPSTFPAPGWSALGLVGRGTTGGMLVYKGPVVAARGPDHPDHPVRVDLAANDPAQHLAGQDSDNENHDESSENHQREKLVCGEPG